MLVSLCAGQGHEVIGVLPDHPRRDDVRAVLVESDPCNVILGRRAAAGQGLPGVEVRQADAGVTVTVTAARPGLTPESGYDGGVRVRFRGSSL